MASKNSRKANQNNNTMIIFLILKLGRIAYTGRIIRGGL